MSSCRCGLCGVVRPVYRRCSSADSALPGSHVRLEGAAARKAARLGSGNVRPDVRLRVERRSVLRCQLRVVSRKYEGAAGPQPRRDGGDQLRLQQASADVLHLASAAPRVGKEHRHAVQWTQVARQHAQKVAVARVGQQKVRVPAAAGVRESGRTRQRPLTQVDA